MPPFLRRFGPPAAVVAALAAPQPAAAAPPDVAAALARITAVGREGDGNADAAAAWKGVVAAGGPALLPTLAAFDAANATAANWLRTAVDAIAESEKKAGRPLPAGELEAFLKDSKHAPAGRRIAYELLVAADPKAPDRLLPGFTDDPSLELRRDAIAHEWKRAEKLPDAEAKALLKRLFAVARDRDQVDELAKALDKRGEKASVTEQFAFLTHWHVVGPFDSAGGSGFAKPYPPEAAVDLAAKYPGKGGAEVGWTFHTTGQKYGVLDLTKALAKHKDAVAYAAAVVVADKETPAEIRVGSMNAVQIFLNGQKLFEREEYHHGGSTDAHVAKGTLKAGPNQILLKVCQNDQKEVWAQAWQFQLRVCDATGGPLPNVVQAVTTPDGPTTVKPGFIPPNPTQPEEKKPEGKK